jgi:hypothetical protein
VTYLLLSLTTLFSFSFFLSFTHSIRGFFLAAPSLGRTTPSIQPRPHRTHLHETRTRRHAQRFACPPVHARPHLLTLSLLPSVCSTRRPSDEAISRSQLPPPRPLSRPG